MEVWQMIISVCAGLVTLLTLLDKLGLIKKVKKTEEEYAALKNIPSQFSTLQAKVTQITVLQQKQTQALLSILRNDLYTCFKENRNIAVWTDDECNVQTKTHEAYKALNGNGEEALWWAKKEKWDIVSNEDYNEILKANNMLKRDPI